MEREKSTWEKLLDGSWGGPNQAHGQPSKLDDKEYMKRQRQATEDYFRTGQEKPLPPPKR